MGVENPMCIIYYIPKGKSVPIETLRASNRANPDGCGVMFHSGYLFFRKGTRGEAGFWNNCPAHIRQVWVGQPALFDYVIHFRTASSASIGVEYCHPHRVNRWLYIMHNGNLPEFAGHKEPDTVIFNQQILKNLPGAWLDNAEICDTLEQYCQESYSKMVFMDNVGKVTIFNEGSGSWIDDVWHSNGGIEGYTGYGFSGAYRYHADDIRHKGGLLSVQMFPPERRRHWGQCIECRGWFLKDKIDGGVCGGCSTVIKLRGFTK